MAGLFLFKRSSKLLRRGGFLKMRGIAVLAALMMIGSLPLLGPEVQQHRDLLTFAIAGIIFAAMLLLERRAKKAAVSQDSSDAG